METSEVKFQKDITLSKMSTTIHHVEEILQKVEFLTEMRPTDLFCNPKEIKASSQRCSTEIKSKKADSHVSNLRIEQFWGKDENLNRLGAIATEKTEKHKRIS